MFGIHPSNNPIIFLNADFSVKTQPYLGWWWYVEDKAILSLYHAIHVGILESHKWCLYLFYIYKSGTYIFLKLGKLL